MNTSAAETTRTDPDIAELRRHVNSLLSDLFTPGIPAPLRRRITA